MIVEGRPGRGAEGELVDHRRGLKIDAADVGYRAVDGIDRGIVAPPGMQHVGELHDREVPVPVEVARRAGGAGDGVVPTSLAVGQVVRRLRLVVEEARVDVAAVVHQTDRQAAAKRGIDQFDAAVAELQPHRPCGIDADRVGRGRGLDVVARFAVEGLLDAAQPRRHLIEPDGVELEGARERAARRLDAIGDAGPATFDLQRVVAGRLQHQRIGNRERAPEVLPGDAARDSVLEMPPRRVGHDAHAQQQRRDVVLLGIAL